MRTGSSRRRLHAGSRGLRLRQLQQPDSHRRLSVLNKSFHVVRRPIEVRVGMQPAVAAHRTTMSPAAADESAARHPALTGALHWGTVIAIVIAVAAMFVRDAV